MRAPPGTRGVFLGFALGLDAVGHCVAIATLIFSGPLLAGLGIGTALFLASTLIATLVLARGCGIPGALGIAQDSSIAIVAAVVASVTAAITLQGKDPLPTAMAIVGVSTLLTGAAFFVLGRFGLGRIVRTIPYPVALGFLASSGWLLTFAALSIVAGTADPSRLTARIVENAQVSLPALAMALSMILALRIWPAGGAVVTVMLTFLVGFYLALPVVGIDVAGARQAGLLPALPTAADPLSARLTLDLVDWWQVFGAAPSLAVIVAVNIIAFYLNMSGAELATRSHLEMDRELRAAGLSNALLGMLGGVTSFVSAGTTILSHKLHASGLALTLSYCGVVLLGGLFAGQIVAVFPTFLAGGFLLFVGFSMLEDWLIAPRKHLSTQDWLTVVAIVGVAAVKGLFVAILAGLLFTLVSFALNYARVPVVRRGFDRSPRRSSVDRSPAEETVLRREWQDVRLARLQGYLFFGSVERLLDAAIAAPEAPGAPGRPEGPGWLILDFEAVTGMDSSACSSLEKLGYLAADRGLSIRLCALSRDCERTLRNWDADFPASFGLPLSDTLDQALEAVEQAILAVHPECQAQRDGLLHLLDGMVSGHPRLADLHALFEDRRLKDGEVLIRKGETGRDIYVVEEGRLAVFLESGACAPVRVRAFAPGAMVGEIAAYLDTERNADVVAVGSARVKCLPQATLARIEREDHELGALIHAVVARSLADKVLRTNQLLVDS